MPKFGIVPAEVPAIITSAGSAPLFTAAVADMFVLLQGGRPEKGQEWLRTAERQVWLHGQGRLYDDGRGIVTSAETALWSHHGFGGGLDVVEKDATPWDAPESFWLEIAEAAEATGRLKSGYRWKKKDRPHVYWYTLPDSLYSAEGDRLRALYYGAGGGESGRLAVWADRGMI